MPLPHRGNMAVTQREWDIMELDARLKVQKIFEEWKQGFLGARMTPPQATTEIDGGLPNGQLGEQLPISEAPIDTLGGGY